VVETQPISTGEMAQHLETGEAEALLAGVPGPVRLAGQWWAVPTGHRQYRPVTDRAAVTAFDEGLARLTAHRGQILARIGEWRQ
jgi:hypothetical protein